MDNGQTTTTIDYTYDPLYRLTSADYSTGDTYQYIYDSVGNRLMQDSSVHGLSSSVSYNYDIANRLADVDGVPYVYDANGNLLNDGTNDYAYDSANRLSSVSSDQGIVSSYGYNGLGDRLSQNGVNYTLDLNSSLTQVLDDGTNTYTYGLGRISQTNTTTEYFLGDALGSVRQLTSQSGQVTYAKSYDPYGVVTQTSGASQSAYGYTGEQQSNDIVYLRARYYSPLEGRFQSRDTWGGSSNNPMSMNRWIYVEGNPVNRTDPSGHHDDCDLDYPQLNITYIEKYYGNFLSKSNWHDTYVAAGIAVQCWATDKDKLGIGAGYRDGTGDGQITDEELSTPWGKPIYKKNWLGNDVLDADKKPIPVKFGLLCYIVTYLTGEVLCECADEGDLKNNPKVKSVVTETKVDQKTPGGAATSMRRRIFQVLDSCINCSATDLFIAAALAQDAQLNMKEIKIASGNGIENSRYNPQQHGLNINWADFYKKNGKNDPDNTYEQVARFDNAITELIKRGWAINTLNRRGIDDYRGDYP